MIVAHNTGNGAWAPQTPDGAQAGPTFKPSGKDCRRFVIVAIMPDFVQCLERRQTQTQLETFMIRKAQMKRACIFSMGQII
jgi:hypothetical protein